MTDPPSQPESVDSEKNEVIVRVSAEKHEYVKGSKLVSILVAVTLAYFLAMLDTSIVATAIPRITTEFHSLADVGWYGSAYQLASCSLQPLSGRIYTNFSTKWTFLGFFLVFEIGSVICGAAKSSAMFTIGRAFAGMGASGILNGSLTIWTASVSPERLPVLQSTLVAIGQLGVALGPLLGGALTQYTTWRWCFYINLPVGAVVGALLSLIRIPEMTQKQGFSILRNGGLIHTLDLVGFSIFAPAAVMFFIALEFGGNRYAWDSGTVIGLLCGAVAAFAVFLVWEWKKGPEAMIPFALLRARIQWCASLLMFAFLGMMFVVAYYLPIYLQAVKGDSPFMSGVHNLPTILSQVVMVLVGGFVVQRIGYYLPSVVLGTTLASVGSGLLSTLTVSTPVGRWVGYQVIYGVGVGMVVQMPFIAIQTLIPRPNIPSALAILIFTQYFGAALFVTTAQSIFNNSMRTTLSESAPGVDIEKIMAGGATAVRSLVSGQQLDEVLTAYAVSVDRVMYIAAALGAVAFGFGCGLGWKDIRKGRRQVTQADEAEKGSREHTPE
ncbi:MFS multidrug transporter [Annulohypoxylon truncatum]|uniref:MFS multidrug transporter n=1 Tax=Annulohypoxylon truncatum TaxID=327061 RepID=UPI002007B973|nr:MFS multidrug transporter [Annulohypoxylon truncatum]KAI1205136.1 MFS multidrug transporter [Annulohypoxylon truncatum]